MHLSIKLLLLINISLYGQSTFNGGSHMNPKKISEKEWESCLSPTEYNILRQNGTEPPGTGKYYKHNEDGTYNCAGCAAPLFSSDTKYDSGSGWPSFWQPIDESSIKNIEDLSEKMQKLSIDDSLRRKIAKKGWFKYHKFFNSQIVSDYMINKIFNLSRNNKTLWGN